MATFVDIDNYLKFSAKPAGNVRPLLWPVMVYNVLYPQVKQRQLNLFQKTVLRLIRAKASRSYDISTLTGLHEDLILLVFAQLINAGWINEQANELTESGLQVLNREEQDNLNLKSGYLFQDAISGNVWPRIENQLVNIQPIDSNQSYPEFVERRQTGKSIKPFKLRYSKREWHTPNNQMMLSAWQDYHDDYRASSQLSEHSQLPKQIKLNSVHYLNEKPESAYILIWVSDSLGDNIWSIKDPFNIRDQAWWLNETFEQYLMQDPRLLKRMSALINQPKPENQSAAEWFKAIQKRVEVDLLIEYPWSERQPAIRRNIAVLLNRQEKMASGQTHSNDLDAAITESQKLLEVLMQCLIKRYPADISRLPTSNRNDKKTNLDLLNSLQLPAFEPVICNKLANQPLKTVINSCTKPSSSLKALVFAAALGSSDHQEHPFNTLNAQQLQLKKLLELADLRNQTSHGQSEHTGKPHTEITQATAEKHLKYALQFTELFKEWI